MLRRRSGVMQKENNKAQKTGDLSSEASLSCNSLEKMKNSPFFTVPSLFVSKGLQDSDSVKSPTSPLDRRIFSNLSFSLVPSPRSPGKSWDCSRVGLGLVADSLSEESKNILLGSQMRTISIPTPKTSNLSSISTEGSIVSPCGCHNDIAKQIYSNPKPNSDFFVSDSKSSNPGSVPRTWSQLNSGFLSASLPVSINSIHGFMDSLSASEIELSEDYTCITSHGPNPKKTHIFGDRVLENYAVDSPDSKKKGEGEGEGSHWIVKSLENSPPFPSNDFLSFCCFCLKKLEVGKDIYMYRGEKAFCSCNCREQEMLLEEETELGMGNPATCSYDSPSYSSFHEDLFH